MDAANRTGDDVFHQSLLGATTNASQEYDHSRYNSMRKCPFSRYHVKQIANLLPFFTTDKSFNSGADGGFQLPNIGKNSPFKGFLDISIVTQKLRKNIHSQDGTVTSGLAPFEFGAPGGKRGDK